MPKPKKHRSKPYPIDVLQPKPRPETSWLLRSLARLLRQIADELVRIAGG